MAGADGHTVTALLIKVSGGDEIARQELFRILYHEFHSRAHNLMKGVRRDPIFQTTALIHEMYLKLVNKMDQTWENRNHFIGVSVKAMRQVLVDISRRRRAIKRGANVKRTPFEIVLDSHAECNPMISKVGEALDELREMNYIAAEAIEYRYFGGMEVDGIAKALGQSKSTIERNMRLGKAWLKRKLSESE